MQISEKLAEFALAECRAAPLLQGDEVRPDAPADEARAVTQLSLIDWIVVGLSGRSEHVSGIMRAFAQDEGGSAQASMIGGGRVPARMAALVNGTISHALDYDDTHFDHIGHPSVGVIPAALAVAQHRNASGAEFQEAALMGMEASVRFGLWLGRDHYQVGFHQTATAGAVGACVAAGRLMGLSNTQMQNALGVLATRASGLKSQFGTMGKPFNAGLAAANGVEAASLAEFGLESRLNALEGPQGFGETHHGAADASAFDGLGDVWHFERVSHKFHACCHGLHAALEAAASLSAPAAQIRAIHVATNPRWMSVCNQPAPETGLGAKFSYTTVLALHFLGHDTARLHSFSDALCADPEVQALRSKVEVTPDASLGEMQARLDVTLTDGAQLQAFHDLHAPLALQTRKDKIKTKACSLFPVEEVDRLFALIEGQGAPEEIAALLEK